MGIRRAAIVGRGAVGLLYGSVIERSLGPDAVEYVMDDTRYARHEGERVTVNGEPLRVRTLRASEARPVDLVIVTTKATGLVEALDTLERLVAPHTRIVSLINGIRSEQIIAERFGWENTVVSVAQGMDAVYIGTDLAYSHPGEIRFGAAEGTSPEAVRDIDDFLTRAGIVHVVEGDIRHRIWTKLMLNVGINQTCMAYGGTYGTACEPGGEQLRCMVAAMREARAVANAEGVDVTEADLAAMVALVASLDAGGMPSMAQDRINRKRTEVEEFAGTVIRLAREHGILVPQNEWLYDRIREIEATF